jgi:hypothetical protein
MADGCLLMKIIHLESYSPGATYTFSAALPVRAPLLFEPELLPFGAQPTKNVAVTKREKINLKIVFII